MTGRELDRTAASNELGELVADRAELDLLPDLGERESELPGAPDEGQPPAVGLDVLAVS